MGREGDTWCEYTLRDYSGPSGAHSANAALAAMFQRHCCHSVDYQQRSGYFDCATGSPYLCPRFQEGYNAGNRAVARTLPRIDRLLRKLQSRRLHSLPPPFFGHTTRTLAGLEWYAQRMKAATSAVVLS